MTCKGCDTQDTKCLTWKSVLPGWGPSAVWASQRRHLWQLGFRRRRGCHTPARGRLLLTLAGRSSALRDRLPHLANRSRRYSTAHSRGGCWSWLGPRYIIVYIRTANVGDASVQWRAKGEWTAACLVTERARQANGSPAPAILGHPQPSTAVHSSQP